MCFDEFFVLFIFHSSEKPTYANLFKKSGGPLVASGPLSLPPAGFSKASATSVAASSQPSSASTASAPTATSAATAATSGGSGNANITSGANSGGNGAAGGGLKEGSPAPTASAGFHGGKQPFRGQGARGGGRGGGLSSGNPSASRDRYHPSRDSVSSNVSLDF